MAYIKTHPNSTQISKCRPDYMNNKQIFLLCLKAHKIEMTYSKVVKLTHMAKKCFDELTA